MSNPAVLTTVIVVLLVGLTCAVVLVTVSPKVIALVLLPAGSPAKVTTRLVGVANLIATPLSSGVPQQHH